jgi:hypothetical protein
VHWVKFFIAVGNVSQSVVDATSDVVKTRRGRRSDEVVRTISNSDKNKLKGKILAARRDGNMAKVARLTDELQWHNSQTAQEAL